MGSGGSRGPVFGQNEDQSGYKKMDGGKVEPSLARQGSTPICKNLEELLRDQENSLKHDNIFNGTDNAGLAPPPFLEKEYKIKGGLFTNRVNHPDISVWNYYTNTNETLGTGISGAVIQIQHKITGEKYAYKYFNFNGLTQKAIQVVYNEIDLYLEMSHPHVAALVEIFTEKKGFGLVMELCTGGNLVKYRIEHQSWTDKLCQTLFFQCVMAVYALHVNDIAIRDIKLDNFVVQENSLAELSAEENMDRLRVKIIDFGISRKMRPGVPMTTKQGTIEYMAPEVYNHNYDLKADMWSLGCCLFALLFARFPYERSQVEKGHIEKRQYGKDTQYPGEIDPEAAHLLTALLSYDPDERPSCVEVMQHPWLKEQVSKLHKAHNELVTHEGKGKHARATPTKRGIRKIQILRSFYEMNPIVRAMGSYASRFCPARFRNTFDEYFLALTDGQPTLDLAALGGEVQAGEKEGLDPNFAPLKMAVTAMHGYSDKPVYETAAVKSITWYEFISAMLIGLMQDEKLEKYIMQMAENANKGAKVDAENNGSKTSVTMEEAVWLFGTTIAGTDTRSEFDSLLKSERFTDPADSKKLDLMRLLKAEREDKKSPGANGKGWHDPSPDHSHKKRKHKE